MCTVYSPSSFSAKTNFCIIVDTSTDRQTTARVPLPATCARNETLFLFAGAGEQNLGVCLTRPRESVFSKGNRKRDRDSSRDTHSCILPVRLENKTSHMYIRVAYFLQSLEQPLFLDFRVLRRVNSRTSCRDDGQTCAAETMVSFSHASPRLKQLQYTRKANIPRTKPRSWRECIHSKNIIWVCFATTHLNDPSLCPKEQI